MLRFQQGGVNKKKTSGITVKANSLKIGDETLQSKQQGDQAHSSKSSSPSIMPIKSNFTNQNSSKEATAPKNVSDSTDLPHESFQRTINTSNNFTGITPGASKSSIVLKPESMTA